ncbi:MAG TPA: PIN domain-containing protein [Acidobacteriota bacterium]|nr:PIN domain-containing protein [Acidobacteriota bacterium]
MYLLDTNICIYIVREKPASVLTRFSKIKPGDVGISVITLCELEFGVENSSNRDKNREALNLFVLPLVVFSLTVPVAEEYGRIRYASRKNRIGAYDLLIAAHAIQLGFTLVTNNIREFQRIPGLRYENWAQ